MEKNNQDRKQYLKIIRNMTPEDRLKKCFELNELTKQLFLTGLKNRFPKSRGKRKKQGSCQSDYIIEDDSYNKSCSKSWARLIKKIYEVDPLLCPIL